jgi:hypothetical protein
MKSLNYFIYMHSFIILIVSAFIGLIVASLVALLIKRLSRLLSLSELMDKILNTLSIMAVLIGSFWGLGLFMNKYDQGGIQKLFIIDGQEPIQITLWLTRIHSKRVGANYDHLIKTFDLETGQAIGAAKMVDKNYSSGYYVYRTTGEHAWGQCQHTSIQYLNLKKPQVIYNDELIQINPKLRQGFEVAPYNTIDPVTHGIRIVTKDGMNFQIDPDLTLKPVYHNHKAPEQNIPEKWYFHTIKGNLGYKLHAENSALSKQSSLLLKPEFIEELNLKETFDSARWVSHPSALYDRGEPQISYIAADGRQLQQINLKDIINKKAQAIYTYSTDRYVYVFVTSGKTFHANIKGFTLVALKTDKVTGEILKKIQYF